MIKYSIDRSASGLVFVTEFHKKTGQSSFMKHSACSVGGLLAMTVIEVEHLGQNEKKIFKTLAEQIANTCHEAYTRTATHLAPETFHFDDEKNEAKAKSDKEKYYILRPDLIETYYYLWHLTRDIKYKEWAWDIAESIERHCISELGYTGIYNVEDVNSRKDQIQQSFFISETLKYLYLMFSNEKKINLDHFILNSAAHLFYRKKFQTLILS